MITQIHFLLLITVASATTCGKYECPQPYQTICEGDTRGDRRCNHDSTHRVCAKIGNPDTSFFKFTGQQNWCGESGHYGNQFGHLARCPPSKPTWCICKWATAQWINGEGCGNTVEIDCDATDICQTEYGLFFSYADFRVNLKPAHQCVEKKCQQRWLECARANPSHPNSKETLSLL
mgnify:CR=1 FL=1